MSKRRRIFSWGIWVVLALVNLPFIISSPRIATEILAWMMLAAVIHIPAHELGHAVIGFIVRFRIVRIVSGGGPRLFRFTLGRTAYEQRLLPLGGSTLIAARDPDAPGTLLRTRMSLAVFAGPLATLLLALGAESLFPTNLGIHLMGPDGTETVISLGGMVRDLGFLLVVINLLPWPAQSDGGQLRWFLTSPEDDVREFAELQGATETIHHVREGNLEEALDASEGASNNTAAVLARSAALIESRSYRKGHELLLTRFDDPMPDSRKALFANNIAWAGAHLDVSYLDEADAMSQLAIELLGSDWLLVASTRGRVLRMLGRSAEAIPLLTAALDRGHLTDGQSGVVYADRALARIDIGDTYGARTDADAAYGLDPDSPIVQEAISASDRASVGIIVVNLDLDGSEPGLNAVLRDERGSATLKGAIRHLTRHDVDCGAALLSAGWPAQTSHEAVESASRVLGLPLDTKSGESEVSEGRDEA